MKRGISVVLFSFIFSIVARAESNGNAWSINPFGRAWITAYSPHDDSTFLDTGSEVNAIMVSPHNFRLAVRARLLSQAGFNYSTNPDEPRTPVDVLHQGWIWGLSGEVRTRIPLQFVIQRECYHFIDKNGFNPVLWTSILAGAGTWMPYESRVAPFGISGDRVQTKWFLLAGPSIRLNRNSAWSSNSPLDAEIWSAFSARKNLNSSLLFDFGGNWDVQFTENAPKTRHAFSTELGLTWHAGNGGWRISFGRRWHDDRFLWPTRDKNFVGLEFVF